MRDIKDMIAEVYGVVWTNDTQIKNLERLVELARADEREACVQIVENEAFQYASPVWAFEIVNDIKARGQA